VNPAITLKDLKQQVRCCAFSARVSHFFQISKETGEPTKDMKLLTMQRKEFQGDSTPLAKLGIKYVS
jgi:hypothetical protein